MGLDIFFEVEGGLGQDYYKEGVHREHKLSRTFCNLMCRRQSDEAEPELDQIGVITGTDISLLYQMLDYVADEETINYRLSFAETEEEKHGIIQQIKEENSRAQGNLPKVMDLVETLLDKLASIKDLPQRLSHGRWDILRSSYYFADYPDKGDGYTGNNFEQDLRTFKRFLEYARNKGITTIYFTLG